MGRKSNKFSPKDFFKLKPVFGFTLSEVIIVLAIFGLFVLVVIYALNPNLQLARSRDKRRIADLKKISISLEDYAGDHDCYPERIYTNDTQCQATDEFDYYIKTIPCDPKTRRPYRYVRIDNCKQYVIFATLELEQEHDYGYGNYFLASENVRGVPTIVPPSDGGGSYTDPKPTLPPESTIGYYACIDYVCTPISDPGVCSYNFINLTSCIGEACCSVPDIDNPCNYPEYQCHR